MTKEYSTELQKLFLEMMLQDAQSYVRVQNIYNPENFDRSLREVAKFIKSHTDDHKDNEQANERKTYSRYGLIIYYNDDYQGGELVYPNLGIVHKPKARSLLIHSGKHLHGTSKVIGNLPRYCSTTFFIGNKDHHPALNEDVFGHVPEDTEYQYY